MSLYNNLRLRYSFFLLLNFFLRVEAQPPKLVLPIGHSAPVSQAVFSPDGKKVLTTSYDNMIKVWGTEGFLLYTIIEPKGTVNAAQFSPDGKKMVLVFEESTAIWDVTTGSKIITLDNGSSGIKSATFSSNGEKLLTLHNFSVNIWNAQSGELLLSLDEREEEIVSAEFDAGAKRVVTASKEGTTVTWDLDSGKPILVLKGSGKELSSACFSSDGKKIVTASKDSTARIWDATGGETLLILRGHKDEVKSAVFSYDGKRVLTASEDNTAKVWDATTGITLLDLTEVSWVNSAVYSRDDEKILTFSNETVRIFNANTGLLITDLNIDKHTGAINSATLTNNLNAAFSTNGKKVVTASSDHTAKIWDAGNGRFLVNLAGRINPVVTSAIDIINSRILTAHQDGIARLWNINTGQLTKSLAGHDDWVLSVQFSPDKKRIISSSRDERALIRDTESGELITELKGHSNWVISSQFSPDGKTALTASWDKTARTWDTKNGQQLLLLDKHRGSVNSASFSPDGSKIFTTSSDSTAILWSSATGKEIYKFKASGAFYSGSFSRDGSKLLADCADNTAKVWNVTSGKLLGSFENGRFSIPSIFSNDGTKILFQTDQYLTLKDIETRETVGVYNGGIFNEVYSATFNSDDSRLITVSETGEVTIWDVKESNEIKKFENGETGLISADFLDTNRIALVYRNGYKIFDLNHSEPVYIAIPVDSAEYISQIPSGYYQTTNTAAKHLHYVTPDLKVITFEQLDVKYNRPDKVLEAIGNTDTALIRSYRKAWEKRIRKLGIDTTAFREGYGIPETDFANRESIEYEQKNEKLQLHIKGMDSSYRLDRFNIWVNEVPVYGQRGISISKRNKNEFDSTITIQLSHGENRIETSIQNVNGTESYRMPLVVNYTPAVPQRETTRFIGIGIDQFADSEYNLQYSVKDIRDLADRLKRKYKGEIIIDTLFNTNVTVSNIKSLKQKLQQTTPNDKVIIAYSGHGLLSKEYDYYLSTYAVNFENPEQNGLPYDELENLLDSIPARKKLMLIDACHSGEVDKEDLVRLNGSSDSLIKGVTPVAYAGEGHLGLKNSFELMQSLFVNVGKSTGAMIISAAAGTQFALERNDLKNGVFTYCILEAMNKFPSLKISELKKIVGERVAELTKGLQKPTSRNETIAVNWNVW